MSDLHLEHYGESWPGFVDAIPGGSDVLVLAGDIVQFSWFDSRALLEIFKRFSEKAQTVVYLPGNHEFYGEGFTQILDAVQEIAGAYVKVLGPSKDQIVKHKLGGPNIIGATLWFPYQAENNVHRQHLADFRMIKYFAGQVYEIHEKEKAFLLENVREGDILVTHHLPGLQSVPEQYKNSSLNRFFVARATEIAAKNRPALWIHGHTHDSCDYDLYGTRVLCNPAGYPREGKPENPNWRPDAKVEI